MFSLSDVIIIRIGYYSFVSQHQSTTSHDEDLQFAVKTLQFNQLPILRQMIIILSLLSVVDNCGASLWIKGTYITIFMKFERKVLAQQWGKINISY